MIMMITTTKTTTMKMMMIATTRTLIVMLEIKRADILLRDWEIIIVIKVACMGMLTPTKQANKQAVIWCKGCWTQT